MTRELERHSNEVMDWVLSRSTRVHHARLAPPSRLAPSFSLPKPVSARGALRLVRMPIPSQCHFHIRARRGARTPARAVCVAPPELAPCCPSSHSPAGREQERRRGAKSGILLQDGRAQQSTAEHSRAQLRARLHSNPPSAAPGSQAALPRWPRGAREAPANERSGGVWRLRGPPPADVEERGDEGGAAQGMPSTRPGPGAGRALAPQDSSRALARQSQGHTLGWQGKTPGLGRPRRGQGAAGRSRGAAFGGVCSW